MQTSTNTSTNELIQQRFWAEALSLFSPASEWANY